ncbi:MAG TPA: hypothetical protein VGM22_13750 [Methylomirabilota bacterium]|jgi:hypothetical protein
MRSQTKRGVIVAVLVVLLAGLVAPAVAADVNVVSVAASQFDSGFFIALVTATSANALVDAQLVVNSTPVTGATVEAYAIDLPGSVDATVFKITTTVNTVKPGDTLTAIVTDVNASSGTRTAVCGKGTPGRHITSICK